MLPGLASAGGSGFPVVYQFGFGAPNWFRLLFGGLFRSERLQAADGSHIRYDMPVVANSFPIVQDSSRPGRL